MAYAVKAAVVVLGMMGVWLLHHQGYTVAAVFISFMVGYAAHAVETAYRAEREN